VALEEEDGDGGGYRGRIFGDVDQDQIDREITFERWDYIDHDGKAKIWTVDHLKGFYDAEGIQLTNCVNSGYIHHIIRERKVEVERLFIISH
jgi:hypothetical protein